MISEKPDFTNPDYNPDWEELQKQRGDTLDRVLRELDLLCEDRNAEPDDIIRKSEEVENAQNDYLATFRMKHRSLGEFTNWLKETHPNQAGANAPWAIMPPETPATFEEAETSWRKYRQIARNIRAIEEDSLRICSPEEYDGPFAFGEHTGVWRSFSLANGRKISALVLHEMRHRHHILIMQDPDGFGPPVLDHIEELANTLVTETRDGARLLDDFEAAAGAYKPSRFDFFVHVPPIRGEHELYAKIDFEITKQKLHTPAWYPKNEIPLQVQSARFHYPKPQAIAPQEFVAQRYQPANDF